MDEEKKDLPVVGADGVQEPVDPEAEQRKAEQEEREKKQKQKQDRGRRTVIYGMAGAYLIYLAVQMIRDLIKQVRNINPKYGRILDLICKDFTKGEILAELNLCKSQGYADIKAAQTLARKLYFEN